MPVVAGSEWRLANQVRLVGADLCSFLGFRPAK